MEVPSASVAARRLHDIGWLVGLGAIAYVLKYLTYLDVWFPEFRILALGTMIIGAGLLYWVELIIFLIKNSQAKTNKYGPNPKSPEMGEIFN